MQKASNTQRIFEVGLTVENKESITTFDIPETIQVPHGPRTYSLVRVKPENYSSWNIKDYPEEVDWKSWKLGGAPYFIDKSDTNPTIVVHILPNGDLRKIPTHKSVRESGIIRRKGSGEKTVDLPGALDYLSHGQPCGTLSRRYGAGGYRTVRITRAK